jgi:hypothetical protein
MLYALLFTSVGLCVLSCYVIMLSRKVKAFMKVSSKYDRLNHDIMTTVTGKIIDIEDIINEYLYVTGKPERLSYGQPNWNEVAEENRLSERFENES